MEPDSTRPTERALPPPRIAVYEDLEGPPRVVLVQEESLPALIEATTRQVHRLAEDAGGRIPLAVIREVVENLVHAAFADAVISILDDGNTVRVADRGPGVADKNRALLPGFSTAPADGGGLLRGVGSGLPFVRAALRGLGGDVDIDDNLGGGTVVTLRVPAARLEAVPSAPAPRSRLKGVRTTERQLKILLLLLELGRAGPTLLATELRTSSSTAFRDLQRLESQGLVSRDAEGLRSLTRQGLAHVEAVL